MRTKIVLLLALTVSLSVLYVPRAAAYELVKGVPEGGAVVRYVPAENPVAKEVTGIQYEVQVPFDLGQAVVGLQVMNSQGTINQPLETLIRDQSVSASFEFPLRGQYFLTLTIKPAGNLTSESLVFRHGLQVYADAHGRLPHYTVPSWAVSGLLVSVWVFVVVTIMAHKRLKHLE